VAEQTTPATPAALGWTGAVRLPDLWDLVTDPRARVGFGKVVLAHDVPRTHPEVTDEALHLERLLRERFEEQQGAIQNSFFCAHLRGGAALVERSTGGAAVERRLHTVLNSDIGDLVGMESECVLAVDQANSALHRPALADSLRMASDAVYSAMTRVLTAADLWADPSGAHDARLGGLAAARAEVDAARARVRATIQRQARFIYFQGTLAGAALAVVVAIVLGLLADRYWRAEVSAPALIGSTVFGALGAVVSVFQRMSTGALLLDFNASRAQLVWLGSLRPAIGSIFGVVVQFALVGGLLGSLSAGKTPGAPFGLFALIGFLSGFSERFATDMVERAGQVILGPTAQATTAAANANAPRPTAIPTTPPETPATPAKPVPPVTPAPETGQPS
jgi:hypothetical protein